MIGRNNPLRVAIADDSRLIYSDDYRNGWIYGFTAAGCEVKVFDISRLRQQRDYGSIYSTSGAGLIPKGIADNISSWRPDLVWCHHGRSASNSHFLDALKRKGIHVSVYLCDEPYETGETAIYSPRFDSVFTMDYETLEVHKKSRDRSNVFYLPPAVDQSKFVEKDYSERNVRAFFLGNADLIPRRSWLEPIDRLIDGAVINFFPHKQIRGYPVSKGHKKWIPVSEHPKLYSSCLVGLNVHRSPVITKECFSTRVKNRPKSKQIPMGITLCEKMPEQEGTGFWNDGNNDASHVNPRFMEMASCGTLVVSDASRRELARLFPMAPAANSPDHFLELVNYYLNHLDEAEEIGRSCSYLISRRHSYLHRALEVLIRLGFRELRADDQHSSLGEPMDWLTPQSLDVLRGKSLLEQIGHSERWSPQFGMSLTRTSGHPSAAKSINVPNPW